MKIDKFNEFKNNNEFILTLIKNAEVTNKSDLVEISKSEEYREVVNLGKMVIPYLLENNLLIWDIALKELTGLGLDSEKYNTQERVEYWKKWKINNE